MRSITAAHLAELDTLPATVDLPQAGRFWGIGRDAAYRLAHSGQFPAPVHRVGARYVVTKADLAAALGVPLRRSVADDETN
ncbi:helix-turn-helix transcriptional regulator [Cellulomonas composti]|uniref:Helix-turn-helix domain-containing protein n=1 Tax=Cellulomonas composti TaxID=266130 RepID=A0A511JBE9_9CELL|nr:helix-turn-helix domain-containing protein [Cellulomonas composti]GEL95298.1 hypothetical protein CCO02nite_19560 [Cellulomonas composti]